MIDTHEQGRALMDAAKSLGIVGLRWCPSYGKHGNRIVAAPWLELDGQHNLSTPPYWWAALRSPYRYDRSYRSWGHAKDYWGGGRARTARAAVRLAVMRLATDAAFGALLRRAPYGVDVVSAGKVWTRMGTIMVPEAWARIDAQARAEAATWLKADGQP